MRKQQAAVVASIPWKPAPPAMDHLTASVQIFGKSFLVAFESDKISPSVRLRLPQYPGCIDSDNGDYECLLADVITDVLTAWTWTDKAGNAVPLSADAIQDTSVSVIEAIYDAILDAAAVKSALQKWQPTGKAILN